MTKPQLTIPKGELVTGSHCPECGGFLDGATGVFEGDQPDAKSQPKEGDVSICFYCSSLLKYGENLQLRNPTEEELAEIKADEKQWAIITHLREAMTRANEEREEKKGLTILGHGVDPWED